MKKPVVVILDSSVVPDSNDCVIETEILGAHCSLRHCFVASDAEAIENCRDADAIILWHHVDLNEAVLRELRACRVIVRNGVGFDNVDVGAAALLGIPVCNVPDYGTEEVADHAITLALALIRRLIPSSRDVREGRWNWRAAQPVRRTSELTFGVLGLGRIGAGAALRAKALRFRVVFFDPYLCDGVEKALGLERTRSLEQPGF